MPRRLPFTQAKVLGNFFMLFAALVIVTQYYCFAIKTWGPIALTTGSKYAWTVLILFHILISLLTWCFIQVVMTDPGQVPPFWGFHVNDSEKKRKRYCLMCNLFKPQRCHHCSVCNRCVINMDHHCPWVNNCIGFWNRKYFILLLIYVHVATYFYTALMLPHFLETASKFVQLYYSSEVNSSTILSHGFLQVAYIFNFLLAILMTFFLKFHLYLILTNKTTIDNLEKREVDLRPYDRGPANNFRQVFGTNWMMLPFPIMLQAGKPDRDGVNWNQEYDDIVSEMVDPMRQQSMRHSLNPDVTAFSIRRSPQSSQAQHYSQHLHPDDRFNIQSELYSSLAPAGSQGFAQVGAPPLQSQSLRHYPPPLLQNRITVHSTPHDNQRLLTSQLRANIQSGQIPVTSPQRGLTIKLNQDPKREPAQHPVSSIHMGHFVGRAGEAERSAGVASPDIDVLSLQKSQHESEHARASTAAASQSMQFGRGSPLYRMPKSYTPATFQQEARGNQLVVGSTLPLRSRTPQSVGTHHRIGEVASFKSLQQAASRQPEP